MSTTAKASRPRKPKPSPAPAAPRAPAYAMPPADVPAPVRLPVPAGEMENLAHNVGAELLLASGTLAARARHGLNNNISVQLLSAATEAYRAACGR